MCLNLILLLIILDSKPFFHVHELNLTCSIFNVLSFILVHMGSKFNIFEILVIFLIYTYIPHKKWWIQLNLFKFWWRWGVKFKWKRGHQSGSRICLIASFLSLVMFTKKLEEMRRICFVLIVIYAFASTVWILQFIAFMNGFKSANMYIMMLSDSKRFRNILIVLQFRSVNFYLLHLVNGN